MNGFLGSAILETAIGVAFVYFLLALFCTTVNEWIANLLNSRAANLRDAIRELLNGQSLICGRSFLDAFYGHPLIGALMKEDQHPPYLPARSFTAAVVDLATSHVEGAITYNDLETGIRGLPPGTVRTAMLALLQNTDRDLARAQASLENWFNDAMGRASGWYKRRAQISVVIIAAAITIGLNADTLALLHRFYAEPALRMKPEDVLGWNRAALHVGFFGWLARALGWCVTIAAVSLGAPFWFDLLNQVAQLRREPASKG